MKMYKIKTILLAEDNPNDVELILEAFSQHNLVNNVQVVHDGAEALDFLYRKGKFANRSNGNPICVLLDIKMPKVNGLEVLRTIKNDPNFKTIPVIMLTSSKEEKDIIESYNIGVNAYIIKPVDFTQFIDVIGTLGYFWAVLNEPPINV
jgi:CheY-like chemotaxis protein